MVLKTRSCSLFTIPSRSSPREAIDLAVPAFVGGLEMELWSWRPLRSRGKVRFQVLFFFLPSNSVNSPDTRYHSIFRHSSRVFVESELRVREGA
jgi:hypothetical protein